MSGCLPFFVASLLLGAVLGDSCSNIVDYESTWDEGASGTIHAKFPIATSSWHMTVTFDSPITDFTVWVGDNIECTAMVLLALLIIWIGMVK